MEKVITNESKVSTTPQNAVITKDKVKDLGEMIGSIAIKTLFNARLHKHYERLYYGAIG